MIPLHVIIGGEDLLDQVQITAEEYVARMPAPSSYRTPRSRAPASSRRSLTACSPTATTAPSLSRCAASGPPAMPTPA
ncbi:MAG: hypothetical protein ACLTYW_07715 [Collinsella sp.]